MWREEFVQKTSGQILRCKKKKRRGVVAMSEGTTPRGGGGTTEYRENRLSVTKNRDGR